MSKESAAAKVAVSAVSQATYDSGPIRHFLAWSNAVHPARKQEQTELINGYIAEQEAAALAALQEQTELINGYIAEQEAAALAALTPLAAETE